MNLRSLAWISLGIGLVLTAITSLEVKKVAEHETAHEFAKMSDQVALKISERLDTYALLLKGGAGFFAASSTVERSEWRAYVEKLRTQDSLLGVQGIGFSKVINPGQLASHIASVRAEGFPEYDVYPAGQREIYTSIIFLEPFDVRNRRAFGYDMFSEPVRRAAMEQARDTGNPALSGKVLLVQESDRDVQAGTLMYVPVYRNGAPTDTVEQRRAALIGWSYSPYRMTDLLSQMIASLRVSDLSTARIRLYDGVDASADNLLFDSRPNSADKASDPHLFQRHAIEFGGRNWLLIVEGTPETPEAGNLSAWGTAAAGAALSGMLCGLLLALARTQSRAAQIADKLTAEIRQHADALQRSENRLKHQAKRYEVLLRSSSDGMCVMNAQGRIEETSDSFCSMLGYPRERMIGMHVSEWDAVFNKDELADIVARTIADGKRIEFETRHRRSDGTIVPVEVSAVPVTLDDEALIFCLTRDISGRKLVEQSMQDRREELEREVAARTQALVIAKDTAESANRAKSAFLATMSHELRTPMTAIMGMTQLALLRATDPTQKEQLGRVMSASDHLMELITNVLDLSRIEADRLPLEKIDFTLETVLTGLKSMVGPQAAAKGLDLRVEVEADLSLRPLIGDPTRLGQILINLAGNAVKFSEQGAITVRAHVVEAQPEALLLRWEIADNGIGIDPEVQKELFNTFQQGDTSMTRKYGGSGLGLAISKRLAELMGGHIGIDSVPGQGTTVWFTTRLGKRRSVMPTKRAKTPPIGAPEASAPHFAGRSALAIDDSRENRLVLEGFFEQLGVRGDFASDGESGLSQALSKTYDIIFVDLRMPEMDGFEVARHLKEYPNCAGTPVIALSGDVSDAARRDCMAAGFDDFLAKPYSIHSLGAVLTTWLDRLGHTKPLPERSVENPPDEPRSGTAR